MYSVAKLCLTVLLPHGLYPGASQVMVIVIVRGIAKSWTLLKHLGTHTHAWTVAHQAPLSMRFSRQEYQSAWPFCLPWDLPNPEIEPKSPVWRMDSLPSGPLGKAIVLAKRK